MSELGFNVPPPWSYFRFKVSSERAEKPGIHLAAPGMIVQHVIHYPVVAPVDEQKCKWKSIIRASQKVVCV